MLRACGRGVAMSEAAVPLVVAEKIVKRFGALTANDRVDLTVMPGEIHAPARETARAKVNTPRQECYYAPAAKRGARIL